MAIRPIIYKYPLDLTGTNPDNLVSAEPHTLPTGENRAIVPNYGAFYTESLKVREKGSGAVLKAKEQYKAIQLYQEATQETGKEVCAVVVITDPDIGDEIEIDYQAVGGQFSYTSLAMRSLLDRIDLDEKPVNWGDIIEKPNAFNPAPHLHDAGDLYGFEYVVEALEALRHAVFVGDEAAFDQMRGLIDDIFDELQKHLHDHDNPHRVTKGQVGLGLVENLPIASRDQARSGDNAEGYMTPERTTDLVDARLADEETAVEGGDERALLTPSSASALIDQMLSRFEPSGTVVSDYYSIPADDYIEFDLNDLLGEEHNTYAKPASRVYIKVRNPDSQAKTYNMYINAEAIATYAVHQERYIRVYNYFEESLDFHIRITVPVDPDKT